MRFQNYVCWNPDWVDRVINTEALQPPVSVFLAVHHPVKMFKTTFAALYQGRAEEGMAAYNERQFLQDLFRPKDFAFIPVLGNAGTGKSHMVRWLALNIPPAPNRYVLLIPKVDTNLWDVLNRVLQMPGVRDNRAFDDYRSTLRKATGELRSEKHAREELLNKLALACGVNGPHKMQGLSAVQQDLAQNLPNLLYDPLFRDVLLQDGGVIDRLVTHTIGRSGVVERLEERRGFKQEDLPLRATHVKKASAKAQSFYARLTGFPPLQLEAVEWLNRHVSTAITELLEFRGDALLRLMLDVRAALARDKIELVLLIEDFAKLQGIDLQLLEAIIARPAQEGREPLCALRTVIACTKGYFGTLPDTVRSRGDFYVTLDIESTRHGEAVSAGEVEAFVARYLNATRLSEVDLAAWHQAGQSAGEGGAESAPNACAGCDYRERCHAAFGARDGAGLYPFTPTAIARMRERASPDGFNPRLVLKDVLKPVLTAYADDLRNGRFPPPALVDHFKGSTLGAAVKSELNRLDPSPATRDRRFALLDLWTNGARVIDLDPAIHEAFSLPPLGTPAPPIPPPTLPAVPSVRMTPTAEPRPDPVMRGLPPKLEEQLRVLDAWSNGAELSHEVLTALRKPIFDTVQARINWDAELLVEGFFSGGGRPFKPTSVNFHRQSRHRMQALVQLTIPLDPAAQNAYTDSALALQGLLLAIQHGSWHFRYGNHPGSFYQRKYADQIERWAGTVLAQIRRPHAGDAPWDPAPAAAELLALGARMANRPVASRTTADTQLNALFQNLQSVSADYRAASWKELFAALQERQPAVAEILLAHAACTKGGSRRVQMLDATRVLDALRAIRKAYRPKEELPSEPWDPYGVLRRLREKTSSLLDRAVTDERSRLLAWNEKVRLDLGPDESRSQMLEAARTAVEAARDGLGFSGAGYDKLIAALDGFSARQLSQCFDSVERIRTETDPGTLLVELGRDLSEVTADIDEFITLTKQFLDRLEPRVEGDITHLEGAGELKATQDDISSALDGLHGLCDELKGGEA